MDIECSHCHAKFKIPDNKVPKNKTFSLGCPKCKEKITVDPAAKPPQKAKAPEPAAALFEEETDDGHGMSDDLDASDETGDDDEPESSGYDADDKPFDFLEEGEETALVCESDPGNHEKIKAALFNMGYHVKKATDPRDTLKKMRFHDFDIVVVNERFGSRDPDMNHVLKFMEQMKMDVRRKMYVVLLTDRFRTMDNMIAFIKSVNLVINLENIGDFEKILKRGLADNSMFYRVFRECLTKIGRV